MPDQEPDEVIYDDDGGDTEAVFPPEVDVDAPLAPASEFVDDSVYGSFDPTAVQPTSGPTPSSSAPGTDGGTREQTATPVEFDPKHREPFNGLMYLGALKSTFTWLGHEFVIRTLKTDEVIESGMLIQDVIGTQGEPKAYQAAILAACVLTVDSKILPIPLTDATSDTLMQNRYDYIRRHWFPPTLNEVYDRYIRLEIKAMEVVRAMGNHSG